MKANVTPGFPNLGTGVAHRKHETQPARPKTVTHEKVVYRDKGDGKYESDNGSILPQAILATALLTFEAGVHEESSPSIQSGGGESGGAGASGGWDTPSESPSSDSGSSGSSDSGSSSSE